MSVTRLTRPLILLGILAVASGVASARTVPVTLSWTASTGGAPVDHYRVYWSIDGADYRLAAEAQTTTSIIECESGVEYRFRVSGVSAFGIEGKVSVSSDPVEVPEEQSDEGTPPPAPAFQPNYPNPFNPETTIRYGVPADLKGVARLEIYSLRGERVRLLPADSSPGWHEVVWDGKSDTGATQPSGQYFVRLIAGGEAAGWRITMVK